MRQIFCATSAVERRQMIIALLLGGVAWLSIFEPGTLMLSVHRYYPARKD